MSDPVATIQLASASISALSALMDTLTNAVPKVVTTAAVLAAFLPPAESNPPTLWSRVHAAINMLGCNFKNAANKDAAKPEA